MSNQVYTKISESEHINSTESLCKPPSKGSHILTLLLISIFINFGLLSLFAVEKFTDLNPQPQPQPLSAPLPVNSRQQGFWGSVPTLSSLWTNWSNYSRPGPQTEALWQNLMPKSNGLVRVPFPRQYELPPSFAIEDDAEEAEIYITSGAHQLHCLIKTQEYITNHSALAETDSSEAAVRGHIFHCLDYIRQVIMCTGDTTLEPVELITNPGQRECGFEVDSAASLRHCRRWTFIDDFISQHAV